VQRHRRVRARHGQLRRQRDVHEHRRSFQCACRAGFGGDGVTCEALVDCSTNASLCDPNATCTDVSGNMFCMCNSGYQGDGAVCTDIDECLTDNGGCGTPRTTFAPTTSARLRPAPTSTCASPTTAVRRSGFLPLHEQHWRGSTCSDIDLCSPTTAAVGPHVLPLHQQRRRRADLLRHRPVPHRQRRVRRSGLLPLHEQHWRRSDLLRHRPVPHDNGGCGIPRTTSARTTLRRPDLLRHRPVPHRQRRLWGSLVLPLHQQRRRGPTCSSIDLCLTNNGGCDAHADCANQAGTAPPALAATSSSATARPACPQGARSAA